MIRPFGSFLDAIAAANGLCDSGCGQWIFYPGMLFGSRAKWWDDFGIRATCHEGIDICFFRSLTGRASQLEAGSDIPAWDAGTVINICPDFLGCSVVLEHARRGTMRIISVMAHMVPAEAIAIGAALERDTILGSVADTPPGKPPPHLHLSAMEIPVKIPPERLTWELFTNPDKVRLINPVFM